MGLVTKIMVGIGLDTQKDQPIGPTPKPLSGANAPIQDFSDPLKTLKEVVTQAFRQLQDGEVKQYRRIAEDEYYFIESIHIHTPHIETRQVLEKVFFRHDMPKRLAWLKKECLSVCTKEKGVLLENIHLFDLVPLDDQTSPPPLSPRAQLLAQHSTAHLEVNIKGDYQTFTAPPSNKAEGVITPTPNTPPNATPNATPKTRIISNPSQNIVAHLTLRTTQGEQHIDLSQNYGELKRGELLANNPDNIYLKGDLISSHHADFRIEHDLLYFTDYSTNGSYYQHQKLDKNQPTALPLPCEIRLGARFDNAQESLDYAPIVKFALPAREKTRIAMPAGTRIAVPASTRIVLAAPETPTSLTARFGMPNQWETFDLLENKAYICGRAEDADLKLNDNAGNVSRKHLRLEWLGNDQIEITDLSSNGVFHASHGRLPSNAAQKFDLPLRLRLGAATDRGDMSFQDAPCLEVDAPIQPQSTEPSKPSPSTTRPTPPTPTKITLPEM